MSKKNRWQGFGHNDCANDNHGVDMKQEKKEQPEQKQCADGMEKCDCAKCMENGCEANGAENANEKPNVCEKEVDTINNLKSQLDEWQNKYLRAYADAENAKRRAEIDAKNMVDYKVSAFARDMIPLADNLSLAIGAMQGKVDENTLVGIRAIQDNFVKALEKNGIVKIATVGVKLNPLEHRVVAQVESDEPVDTIVQELQAGYKIGDKVIREAMVATAKPRQ